MPSNSPTPPSFMEIYLIWIYQYFRWGYCLLLKFTPRDVVPLITECGSPEDDLKAFFPLSP